MNKIIKTHENNNENNHFVGNLSISNSKKPPKQANNENVNPRNVNRSQIPLNFSSSSGKLKECIINQNELRSSFSDNFNYGIENQERMKKNEELGRRKSKNSYHDYSLEKDGKDGKRRESGEGYQNFKR